MIEKTQEIAIEDFGQFEEFKKKFALDKIDYANLVFLYKVLIVERYSSKKFNVINDNPLMNVNKLHTKLHNVLSESYINSYKTRNNIKDDNEHVRDRIKDKLREFASLPYHNAFVRFTKYVIDRLKQRCDEIKNIKDEVVKKKAIEKLDRTLWLFSNVSAGMKQVIKEGERMNNEAQKIYDKYKGTLMENFYKNSLLDCVVSSQYCDGLVQLVSDIKKELHGVKTDNNIHMLSNGIRQQALKIIKEIYHIEDKEAKERYHNGLVKLWRGNFHKGMVNFLKKQIQTNLKNEKPEDKNQPRVNNNKNNIFSILRYKRKNNIDNNSNNNTDIFHIIPANRNVCSNTTIDEKNLTKSIIQKHKEKNKNENIVQCGQKFSNEARARLVDRAETNKYRKQRLRDMEERKKELFNTKKGKIIFETKKISPQREKEMINRLSQPKKKRDQINTKNSDRKLTKDEQKDLIDRLYYQPMGKDDKSGKSKLEKPLTNLNNNKTFITELKPN